MKEKNKTINTCIELIALVTHLFTSFLRDNNEPCRSTISHDCLLSKENIFEIEKILVGTILKFYVIKQMVKKRIKESMEFLYNIYLLDKGLAEMLYGKKLPIIDGRKYFFKD